MRLQVLIPAGAAVAALAAAGALLLGGCQKAVLNAPPTATLTINASPQVIPETNGVATVSATVRLASGTLVPDGVIVNFFTTLGTIEPQAETRGGVASVQLRSTGTTGTATVSALSGTAKVATTTVSFGSPAGAVAVSFSPATLPTGGGSATVTARLTDAASAPLPGRQVSLSVPSPATLDSRGAPLTSDANGIVTDKLTTTASATVTATVVGTTVSGQATLLVGASDVANVQLSASPPSLPAGGGSTVVTAFVTAANTAPVPGVDVTFTATSPGVVDPAVATTSASGLASTTLTTTASATVTATVGGKTGSLRVVVGGTSPAPYTIELSAARATVTDRTLAGAGACSLPGPNAQMPIAVLAYVTDAASRPIANLAVTLTLDDDPANFFDAAGGFCPGTASTCCDPTTSCAPCTARTSCPTPTPTPSPTPTPTPPTPTPTATPTPFVACCNPGTLAKTATLLTGADGRATFDFAFEDTDICTCTLARRACTATLVATAAGAAAANTITISFQP